jgi:hypothetical protein
MAGQPPPVAPGLIFCIFVEARHIRNSGLIFAKRWDISHRTWNSCLQKTHAKDSDRHDENSPTNLLRCRSRPSRQSIGARADLKLEH